MKNARTSAFLCFTAITLLGAAAAAGEEAPVEEEGATAVTPPPLPPPRPLAPPAAASSTTIATATATVSTTPGTTRDQAQRPTATKDPLNDSSFLHGFRVGYGYVFKFEDKVQAFDGKSLADQTGMRSPHHFILGYEAFYRMASHSWLNVILVGNASVTGLEQSKFFPTANGIIGFELDHSFQLGAGANLTPLKGSEAHVIFAAGWTPRVGNFYVPVHAFFIPDVDGVHRTGVTTGVTW